MIDILLATYNGSMYLPELLNSLEQQTYSDWRLIVRDDGSTDETLSLIECWAKSHQGNVHVLQDDFTRLGSCGNFAALMARSDGPYFMFCDQDDVWLPDKIARLCAAIWAAEEEYGRSTPILVHTDLILVDKDLNTISNSFWGRQRLIWPDPKEPWKTIVMQNVVTGCALIGNAALREAGLPIPREAIMHDWWLALIAATSGRIIADPKPSVLYRQHGTNTLGAKPMALRDRLSPMLRGPRLEIQRIQQVLKATRRQAVGVLDRHGERISLEARSYLKEYGNLHQASFLRRKSFPFRHRLWFDDALRNAALVMLI